MALLGNTVQNVTGLLKPGDDRLSDCADPRLFIQLRIRFPSLKMEEHIALKCISFGFTSSSLSSRPNWPPNVIQMNYHLPIRMVNGDYESGLLLEWCESHLVSPTTLHYNPQ